MKISISSVLMFLFVTFVSVLAVSLMNVNVQMSKINDYHYATVHEIESSDFANAVINERILESKYDTLITERSVKDDMRIYEVKTSGEIAIPVLGFKTVYTKVSTAR